MITVEEASAIIANTKVNLQSEKKPIQSALHYVLAADCISSIHMPPFRQSAMDGYALRLKKRRKKIPDRW